MTGEPNGSESIGSKRLRPGTRLRGVTDNTEIVVIKVPDGSVDLRCGGHPMLSIDAELPEIGRTEPGFDGGSQIGKRYADDDIGVELLCTKAGEGSLSLGTVVLEPKGTKLLPSSD